MTHSIGAHDRVANSTRFVVLDQAGRPIRAALARVTGSTGT